MNGVPAADLIDTATLKGFIGLQVHGVGGRTEPLHVRWRNLRIQDLGESQWESLLKPDSLDGWSKLPGGEWKMEGTTDQATEAGQAWCAGSSSR